LKTNDTSFSEDPDKRRLDDLGRRIEEAREPSGDTPQPRPGRNNVIYRLSSEFVAAVFVGLALGWGFDALTGWKPVGIILFSVLGIAAAFFSVFRAARQLNAEQERKDK
jgi:ATP synthase protein I